MMEEEPSSPWQRAVQSLSHTWTVVGTDSVRPPPVAIWYSEAEVCRPRTMDLRTIDLTLDPSPIDKRIKEALTKPFPNGVDLLAEAAAVREVDETLKNPAPNRPPAEKPAEMFILH